MSTEHFGRESANEILAAWRKALHEWEVAPPGSREEDEAAERMGSAGGALDNLLSHGGELPTAWGTREVLEGAAPPTGYGDQPEIDAHEAGRTGLRS